MVYEKYITRNGKTYGPYVYESKRINGKVISKYKGQNKKPHDKKFLIFGSLIVIALLFTFVFLFSSQFTGKSILNFENYLENETLSGNINIILKPGELIPENSILLIENGNNTYNFSLNEILTIEKQEGNYFLQDKNLEGTGYGYGFIGKKEINPTIFFELKISPKNENDNLTNEKNETIKTPPETITNNETNINIINETTSETPSEEITLTETQDEQIIPTETSNEEIIPPETTSETPNEEITLTETTSETITPTETAGEETTGAPITGNAINLLSKTNNFFKGFFTGNVIKENTIQGDVKKGKTFTYTIPENSEIEIIEGSVKTEIMNLNDSILSLTQNKNTIEITTNYSIIEEGFGAEYINDEEKNLTINLNKLGVDLVEGKISIKLIYLDTELMDLSSQITKTNETTKEKINTTEKIIEEIFNETIENKTLMNETKIFTEIINLTAEEKNILKSMFQNETINIKAYNYQDKILVDFKIKDYYLTQTYEKELPNEEIEKLIERDKIIWLKDLAREHNRKEPSETEKADLNLTTIF